MRAVLSWSGGKDAAWALHEMRRAGGIPIIGLLTTIEEITFRVSMHGVSERLVDLQATAVGLPLQKVHLPSPCPNDVYGARMADLVRRLATLGITHIVFGDLALQDVRTYRERTLAGSGITPLFPLWGRDSAALSREMLAGGVKARVVTVDPHHIDRALLGREWDESFLADLPAGVDPCGERGEFHTFAWDGPVFRRPVPVRNGEVTERDGFRYQDLLPG